MNSQAATKGFIIHSMQNKISTLEEDRRRLDLEVVDRQALEAINKEVVGLGLVPVAGVDYVSAAPDMVAVK